MPRASLASRRGSGYLQYDGEGSVRQLTNTARAVTDAYEYDGFGNSVATSGSTTNNYLYGGVFMDDRWRKCALRLGTRVSTSLNPSTHAAPQVLAENYP